MSQHTPKYSIRTQTLINACQAAELIPGALVVITDQSWAEMTGKMVDSERALFKEMLGVNYYAITLNHGQDN